MKARRSAYYVRHAYPHDPNAFTQGLDFADGTLYESTGLRGRSTVRRVQLETGAVLCERSLPKDDFGEDLTVRDASLIQLTWRGGVAFVYDRSSFRVQGRLRYSGQGWGLTDDRTHIVLSDGSPHLRFLDRITFEERRRVRVVDGEDAVSGLNSLQYIDGEIFANVYPSAQIARISPETGQILGWIDLSGLYRPPAALATIAVPNGIAFDRQNARLFVTGKLWPQLFEIVVEPI